MSNSKTNIIQRIERSHSLIVKFERKFSKVQNTNFCVATNSATSALWLYSLSLGLNPKDKIITAPISWPQTYFPFAFCGCHFILVDYLENYPVVDPTQINLALENHPDAKAVLIPALYGILEGIVEIHNVCKKYNVPLIIDASQSLYSHVNSLPVGTICEAAVFSFSHFKSYGYGEGGAIVFNDSDLFDRLHILNSHPYRIHSEVIDLELMKENLDGFNFNFRMHPATAKNIITKLEYNFNNGNIDGFNNLFDLNILEPPVELQKCFNPHVRHLIDISNNDLTKNDFDRLQLTTLAYPFLSEIFKNGKAKIFPWLFNSFSIEILKDLQFAEYWKNNLFIICGD